MMAGRNCQKTLAITDNYIGTDLFFNAFKTGMGEAAKAGGIGDAPQLMFNATTDQLKTTLKEISH